MKKFILGFFALVLAAVPTLVSAKTLTLSASAEQGGFKATLVSFSTGRLLCEDETNLTVLGDKYNQVIAGAAAGGFRLTVKLYQIEQTCQEYFRSVAISNRSRIGILEAEVSGVKKEVAQLKSCACKSHKGHKKPQVAKKNHKGKKHRGTTTRRRTQKSCFKITHKRGYWRATKRGGGLTHTSRTRKGIYGWVKKNLHLCESNGGGGGNTTTTKNTRPDHDGGTSGRTDHDGGTSAGSKGDGSNNSSSSSNSSSGRSDGDGGSAS